MKATRPIVIKRHADGHGYMVLRPYGQGHYGSHRRYRTKNDALAQAQRYVEAFPSCQYQIEWR